jgi:FlaA1/EpsC-like NDP-sugar epimerase
MVMMDGSLDAERIAGYFKGKSVLVTGATGFLGKSKYRYKSLA